MAKRTEKSERVRRTERHLALVDKLTDKVGVALDAVDGTDTKELKQISSIIKELQGMQELDGLELRERELRCEKLSRELEARDETCEIKVSFIGGDSAWGA